MLEKSRDIMKSLPRVRNWVRFKFSCNEPEKEGYVGLGRLCSFSSYYIPKSLLLLTTLFLCGFAYAGAYQVNALANGTKQPESTEMEYAIIKGEKWFYVANETQLRLIGNTADNLSEKYLLNNDITLTSDWNPIGTDTAPFTGVFNGNGSAIRGLTMKEPNAEIVGMFGYAKDATLHNIELVDLDITSAGSKVENKKVDAICAVPIDCKMTDNRVYQLENTSPPVEMETVGFNDKTCLKGKVPPE